jgi:hypothetical protein
VRTVRPAAAGAAILLALLAASAAPAQYAAAAGDTLRYADVTHSTVVMHVGGRARVESIHDAVVAVAFDGEGSATAWYEALALETRGPGPELWRAETAPLIGRAFSLSFHPSGRVETLTTPQIPDEIAATIDLTRQFDDFFLTIPEGELVQGRSWADTLIHDRPGRPIDTFRAHHVRSYFVEGDTVVGEVPAVRIRVRQVISLEASSPLEAEGGWASTRLVGTEEGTAVFSVSGGRLLARVREGGLEGEMTLSGGGRKTTFRQEWSYRNRMELVR